MAKTQGSAFFGTGEIFLKVGDESYRMAELKEISLDFSATVKELIGSKQFALAVASGQKKISGKAKTALFSGEAMAMAMFGTAPTAGMHRMVDGEAHTVATASATATNAADFFEDLGVIDHLGKKMERVTSAPAAGQYSVSEATGVYTFNTAENGNVVYISYSYDVATGNTVVVTNRPLGENVVFGVRLFGTTNGKYREYKLNACVATKLGFSFKNEDFAEPDFEFSAFADDNGEVLTISFD